MCRHASPNVIHASQHAALQRALTLCTHAHRRACVTRFVLACSSTCMRAQGPWSFAPCRSTRTRETCAFAERCAGFRPQRPGSHHGRAGFQNNVQVSMSDLHVSMSRFCPGVRQAARNSSGKSLPRLAVCGTEVNKPNRVDYGPVLGADAFMLTA